MKNNFHKILFILTIVMFAILMIQTIWHPITLRSLKGNTDNVKCPEFNFKNYSDGSFQKKFDKYLTQNFGFRESALRIYNQYIWTCYGKDNVNHIVPGKDTWIFYKHHIDDYYGQEMYRWQTTTEIAIDRYEREIRLMKKLRAVLKEYNIEFLMFIAPDKAFIYPEYLPDQEFDTTTINARKYYSKRLAEEGFPNIDMTEMFIKMKDTVDYLLMPSKGAHWNNTCVYGVDTLLRVMETLKNEKLAEFSYGEAIPSYRYLSAESDIEGYMNLWWRRPIPKRFKTRERQFEIVKDSTTSMPNVLFVGNSFLFQVYDYVPVREIFSDMNHWYYNLESFAGFDRLYDKITNIDRLQTILLSDYVVWFADGCQIYKTSYGFVEDAILRLCIEDDRYKEVTNALADSLFREKAAMLAQNGDEIDSANLRSKSMLKAIDDIKLDPERYFVELQGDGVPTSRNKRVAKILAAKQFIKDAEWYNKLKIYSITNDINIDEAVNIEIENINNNKPLIRDMELSITDIEQYNHLVNKMVEEIKSKPELLKEIKKKAVKNKKSLEQAIIDDAQWIVNYRLNNKNSEVENK